MKNSSLFRYFRSQSPSVYFMMVVIVLALAFIGYGYYKYYLQKVTLKYTTTELASTTEAYKKSVGFLRGQLTSKNQENTSLIVSLEAEHERNNTFGAQVESLTSTVGQLYKLSKTDRELLQKYSNIYFLNENYIPSALSPIDPAFLYRKEKPETIHTNIKPYLEKMLQAALDDSTPILILSAYRSFGTQASLKIGYKLTFGTTAANRFSADQGYSEHQLGSTVDFTTPAGGEVLSGFERTKSYTWLLENAHKYGFVLSYEKGNKFFQFEPWHWRYIGVELATKLHTENKNFYSVDQREINEFLVKIFD